MKLVFSRHSRSGFTLVELIVGMTVFAVGLTGVLALLSNTMMNSSYSRHEIVVAGLLREQMELVKNIRDTNLKNYTEWDKVLIEDIATTNWSSGVYIIENNFSDSEFSFDNSPLGIPGTISDSPVLVKNITTQFSSMITDESRFNATRLHLDNQSRYTHNITATGTSYASYIIVSPLGYDGNPVQKTESVGGVNITKNQGYIIDARVIVKNGNNYREYDAKTLITDWVK